MIIIINPWKSKGSKDFEVGGKNSLVFKYNNDYRIYRLGKTDYLYCFKNRAFSQLAGVKRDHLIAVAENKGSGFLFDRAIETLNKHESI